MSNTNRTKKHLLISLFLCFMLPLTVFSGGPLRVGASKVCINPPAEVFPMKSIQQFTGIHDSIWVRTIVLDNGIQRAALISFDLISVPGGEDFLTTLAKELEVPVEYLFVSAVHSHNAPFAYPPVSGKKAEGSRARFASDGGKYYQQVLEASLRSIREARQSLQPARVGFARGKAYVNVNRDQKIGEGYHMGYNPEGPSDKTVALVSFTDLEGEPIAIYANYAVHSVAMYLARTKDGMPEITGDMGGATSAYVERHFDRAVALWTSGAAGDQNPLFMANYNQDAPDVYDEGTAGYAILDVQARRLGEEIVRLTRSMKNTASTVDLWAGSTSFCCPGRQRVNPPEPGVPNGGYLAPAHIPMTDGDPVTVPLSLLMINDIALAGVSAEVFTEIGIHLKEQSLFDRTMMVTNLPNGIGYIPTDAAYLLPSEKAISNRIKPGYAEPMLIESFLGLMEEYLELHRTSAQSSRH